MAERRFPVMEVFGPTVQGEGPSAGVPCYFVRFGGCDYRCSWCDTMFAVDPASVRANAERLNVEQIVQRLVDLPDGPQMIVLSGGNPALLQLGDLVEHLQTYYAKRVAVETQGSRWRDWLEQVDQLVISPKPPSSGMATEEHMAGFLDFMDQVDTSEVQPRAALKIVVFNDEDLNWAEKLWQTSQATHKLPLYLSAGTPVPAIAGGEITDEQAKGTVLARYRWLCETVARRRMLANARVLPQLHVLAWGQAQGV